MDFLTCFSKQSTYLKSSRISTSTTLHSVMRLSNGVQLEMLPWYSTLYLQGDDYCFAVRWLTGYHTCQEVQAIRRTAFNNVNSRIEVGETYHRSFIADPCKLNQAPVPHHKYLDNLSSVWIWCENSTRTVEKTEKKRNYFYCSVASSGKGQKYEWLIKKIFFECVLR